MDMSSTGRGIMREEYARLSYNTRCWVRIRTESLCCIMFVVGFAVGIL